MTAAYIINNLLFVVPCILLLLMVFGDQLRSPLVPVILSGSSIFLAASFLGTYIYLIYPSPTQRLFLSLVSLFTGVLIFSSACQYSFWQSLFIISVIKSYSENVRFFSADIYFLATKELPEKALLQISAITTLLTVLSFPLIRMFFKELMRPALDYTVSLGIWKLVWVIPVCNNGVYTITITPDAAHYTLYLGNEFFFIPPLWILLTFSSYGILLKMMIDVSKNAALQESLHLSETQIAAQKKQMELLQARIQETSRFRHDIRHHFLAIDGFLKNDDTDGLKEYIRQSITLLPGQAAQVYCDNVAVNALLCYYKEQAERVQIKTTFLIILPKNLPVPDTELCIIIGNLLENAVEACQRMKAKDRFMEVRLSMAGSSILAILVSNSYEGIVQQAGDGTFLSSKGKDRKGIGLSSVLNIAEKYNGVAKTEYGNQVFKVSLLLSQSIPSEKFPPPGQTKKTDK